MAMTKRQQAKLEKLLAQMGQALGKDEKILLEQANPLHSTESSFYEAQAVINYFKYRIKPLIEKGEKPEDFDKRYREWRIKICEGCGDRFAYSFAYDGVKYCSYDCLEKALLDIGIVMRRDRELKLRWGVHYHPAVVPSSALESLETLYADAVSDAYVPSQSDLPKSQNAHHSDTQEQDIHPEQDMPDNVSLPG